MLVGTNHDDDRPRPMRSRARAALAIAVGAVALLAGISPTTHAQPDREVDTRGIDPEDIALPELAPYEDRLIRRLILQRPVGTGENQRIEPLDRATEQTVRNQLRATEGQPYRQRTVSEDISRLNRIGRFGRVLSRVQLLDDGTVQLIYTLVDQPVIIDIQAVGNRRISDREIADLVEMLNGTPVDPFQLDRAARSIEDLYRERGYYLAEVTVDQRELEETGIVLFRIREGERVKVTDIRFEGNNSFRSGLLRKQVRTKEAWLLGKGPLDDDQLDVDVAEVLSFYRDRGYLDARVDRTVRPSPNGKEAIVVFLVDEGELYTLRRVDVVYDPEFVRDEFTTLREAQDSLRPGEHLFSAAPGRIIVYRMGQLDALQVAGLMTIKSGDVFSANQVSESEGVVRDALRQIGYASARVRTTQRRDPDQPLVDLVVNIAQGERYRTGAVRVIGNDLTKQKVIQRHVQNKPGRYLDATATDTTETRLRAINLFTREKVKADILPPDEQEPEFRDIVVEIEETNTGTFSIGALLDSDDGIIGSVSLEQRNFDIADTPDSFGEFTSGRAFRGAGQTLVLEALPGTQVQTYQATLADPYLLETNFSGSSTVFYRRREYDEFDEERYGGRFALGRRFGTRWEGQFQLRLESVQLFDISADEPVDVFESADQAILAGLGVNFTRNTLDNRLRPSKGTRITLGAEQILGDYQFTKFNASHLVFFNINEDYLGRKTILSFKTAASYIPQDVDEVPVYERYYLGGRNFRGFDFRTVSPKGIRNDTMTLGDDPVGGTWSFFWGAEVKQPILEDFLAVVAFLDTGTVTNDVGFDDYRVSVGTGIRIFIPQLSPAPLAFDFGFPIVKQDGDKDRLFSFSVDLPF